MINLYLQLLLSLSASQTMTVLNVFWRWVIHSRLHAKWQREISIVCEQIVQTSSPCNIDALVNQYHSSLHNILHLHAPKRTITMKGSRPNPWYTTKIDEARKKCRKCETLWRHTRTENHRQMYIAANNESTNLIANTRITYFQLNLDAADHKSIITLIKSLKGREPELLPNFDSKI